MRLPGSALSTAARGRVVPNDDRHGQEVEPVTRDLGRAVGGDVAPWMGPPDDAYLDTTR
jgi:hypothetical protein